jgi:hypothetical protein
MTIPYNTTALQGIKYLRYNFVFDELETNIRRAKNMNNPNIFDKDIDFIDDLDLDNIDVIQSNSDLDSKNILNNNQTKHIKQIWFKHNINQKIKLELDDFK